jgi:hypothetical protein
MPGPPGKPGPTPSIACGGGDTRPGGCMLKLPLRVAGGLDQSTGPTAEPWELQDPAGADIGTSGGIGPFGICCPMRPCSITGLVGVRDTDWPGELGKGGAVLDIDMLDMDWFRLLVDRFKLVSLKTCVLALLPEGVAWRYRRCPVPQLGDPERARWTPMPRAEDTSC